MPAVTSTTTIIVHPRRASQDQTRPVGKVPGPHPGGRVEATRVDAEQFIDSMLRETIGEFESTAADRSDEGSLTTPAPIFLSSVIILVLLLQVWRCTCRATDRRSSPPTRCLKRAPSCGYRLPSRSLVDG